MHTRITNHFLPMAYNSPIAEDYATSLRDLTFNSRPLIVTLTTIARENTDYADGILQAITTRIYKCIPEQKLFTLYLLDSICKTVGNPYNILIGDEIFRLFSHVYLLVGEQTRARLVKMYDLWKVFRTKGTNLPLFPSEQMDKIDSFLTQAGFRRADPVPTYSAKRLVEDIDTLLPIMQKKLAQNQGDTALAGRCTALTELRVLLQSQELKQNELAGILEKLSSMKHQELYTVPSTPITPAITPATTPGAPTPAAQAPPKALPLFEELIASGLVKVDQSLKPGSKPVYELIMPKHKFVGGATGAPTTNALEQLLMDANISTRSQYDQIKFKELVKVNKKLTEGGSLFANLQKFVSSNVLDASTVQVLYETKSLKCAQCGKRFTNDDAGAAKKRVHLDWHFRINKKLANHKSNIQSRNWYLDDLEWVKFDDNNLLEYGTSTVKKEAPTSASQSTQPQYVVIPSTESNMNNMCTICREQVKATYNDQLGEWVWDGCMYAPGQRSGRKIVHVACHQEASRKRGADSEGDHKVKRERVY